MEIEPRFPGEAAVVHVCLCSHGERQIFEAYLKAERQETLLVSICVRALASGRFDDELGEIKRRAVWFCRRMAAVLFRGSVAPFLRPLSLIFSVGFAAEVPMYCLIVAFFSSPGAVV